MKKRAIPGVPVPGEAMSRQRFDAAVKENLEILSGQRGGRIAVLQAGSSLDEVVAKINEILARMQ